MSYKNYYRYRKMMANGGPTDPPNKTDSVNVRNSSLEFEKAIKNLGYEQDPNWLSSLDEYLSYEDGKIIPNFYLGRINKKETPKGYTSYPLPPNTYKMGSAERRDGEGEIGEGYKYLEQISPTKYIASELISPDGYNTDLPTFELDSRIEPQGVRYYEELNDKVKFPYYDPLAVTPWQDLTPEEQVERRDKYGDTGTPYDPAIPKRSALSLAREVKRDALTQEMKDAGFTGYSAREVLKPGSDAAKAWEAFQNKDSNSSTSADNAYLHESLKLSEKDANQEFHTDEEGTWGNLEDIWNFRRVEKPVTEKPVTEKPAPVIEKPKYPKSAPEGYSLVKGYKAGDSKWYGNKYVNIDGDEILAGPTKEEGALMRVPGLSNFLPKKQYGGPISPISTETLPLINEVTKNLAKSEENKQFLISMANSPLFGERYKRMSGNPDLTDKEIESYRQDIINNLNTARPIHQRSEVLEQKGASGYYRPRTKEAVIALNPKDSTQEFLKKKEEQYNKWFPKQSHSMNLSYGYDFNPSIDLHERSHSSTIGDLDLRKKDGPIARFAKGEDAHIGNYAEGTFLETPYQKLFPTLNTKQEKYLTEPTEQKSRKDVLAKYAQERGIYDPVNETFNETHYEKLIDDYYRVGGKKDREKVENIFNKDPYIYHQLDDTLKNYNKENVINMFNDFVQNENQEQELPMAAYGGPIETPWFMPDVYANGGTVDGDPPLTWKNNKDYIQGIGDWGIASDVPITNRQSDDIKRKLRTGKYGYDPSTGTLNILNENDWGTISAEDAPYVNQAIAHANRTPEEQQAFEKAKQENEYKKFKSGKQRVKIDQFTEGFKGKKIGDVAHLTDDEYNNYLNQWDKNSYDQISKGMLWNTPGMVATAGLLPNVGVLPGVIPGVAAGANEFYQGNPGKGALYTGLSLLPGIPSAYQGIKKGVSTTTTPLGKNLIATDFPANRFARKHLTSSKTDPFLNLLSQRHPDITNLVRNKDGFSLMRQNPKDKSYYFNAYMTNPRDAGKTFKYFESKLPPGALVKNPSTGTLSDDSFGFILNRTKNKNYTPEITGESVYLNPYAGKSMGEVSGIRSSGNVTKIDGNSVMTFPNKKDALKHAEGINAKIDKANFNTKKVSAEVVPVPGSVNEYAIKVPNIGIRNTPKPTSKGVPAVNTKVPPKGDEPYLGSTQSNLTKEESIINSFSTVKKPITKYDSAGNIVRESKIPQPVLKKLPWEKWNPETIKDKAIMDELLELEKTTDIPNFNLPQESSKLISPKSVIKEFADKNNISFQDAAAMQYLMGKTKAFKEFAKEGIHSAFHGASKGDLTKLKTSKSANRRLLGDGLYQTNSLKEAKDVAKKGEIYHLGQPKKNVLDINELPISNQQANADIAKYTSGSLPKNNKAAGRRYKTSKPIEIGDTRKVRSKDYFNKVTEKDIQEGLSRYGSKETIPSWMKNNKGEVYPSFYLDSPYGSKWTKTTGHDIKNLLGNKGTFDININDINQALLPIMGAGALGAGLPEKALGGAVGDPPVSQYKNKGNMNYNKRLPKKYAGGMIDENQMDTMNKYEFGFFGYGGYPYPAKKNDLLQKWYPGNERYSKEGHKRTLQDFRKHRRTIRDWKYDPLDREQYNDGSYETKDQFNKSKKNNLFWTNQEIKNQKESYKAYNKAAKDSEKEMEIYKGILGNEFYNYFPDKPRLLHSMKKHTNNKYTKHPAQMAYGGAPEYEAEGGEVIVGGTPKVYNGGNLKQISEDSFKIEGNSHENGGVAMSGGDYVYSDRIALDDNILSQLDL